MSTVTVSQRVQAPLQRAFDVCADLRQAERRIRAIRKLELLTDGPVGRGTRFRESRVMFGREATEEMEITGWNPPHGYEVGCDSCGCRFRTVIELKPDGPQATIIEMRMTSTPMTVMAKIMSPMGRLLMGSCRKAIQADLDDLRAAIEGNDAPPPTDA